MLLRDPFAGHRNTRTGGVDGNAADWTAWDFAIASAVQAIEDGTLESGHLIWEIEADDVDVRAIRKIDKSRAEIERITGADKYKAADGEYYITELHFPYRSEDDPEPPKYQTRKEWIAKLQEKAANGQ